MNSSILVTGGTGILGRHLVKKLLENNAEVTILCRTPKPELFATHPALHWLQGDVARPDLGLSPADHELLADKIDTVYHLAARTDFKGKSLADYQPVNMNGVCNVYTLASTARAPLHHVSTAFVCGRLQGQFTEEMLDQGQKFRNFYEQSKFYGELFLRKKQNTRSIPVTIYRPGIILERHPTGDSGNNFGPFTFLDAIFRLLLSARRHGKDPDIIRVRGHRESSMPFVFDDKVADIIYALSKNRENRGKTFHLTTRNAFANQEIETLFNQAFGQKVVCWATADDIADRPLQPPEELLARRTAVYADYLDLSIDFARNQLETALGHAVLADLDLDEVLQAFSAFLACKKRQNQVISEKKEDTGEISDYFTGYLPGFLDRPLLKNLLSLNALFWLKIQGAGTWTIRIGEGCLRAVSSGAGGSFGYTVTPETFLQVVRGLRSPQEGFFRGEIAISGNTREGLRTATALEEFFSRYPYQQEGTT